MMRQTNEPTNQRMITSEQSKRALNGVQYKYHIIYIGSFSLGIGRIGLIGLVGIGYDWISIGFIIIASQILNKHRIIFHLCILHVEYRERAYLDLFIIYTLYIIDK